MNPPQYAALIGFLFVAAWAALGFGDAVLCLVGALVFYGVTAFYRGELDLADFQQRAVGPRGSRSTR
ncbi:MAG: hypothetical protein WAK93_04770 [Solirubrobacteraceae bacterium]